MAGAAPSQTPEGAAEYPYNHPLNIRNDNYRNYYEIFVASFYDSDGDGMGDLNGVTEKLDYINLPCRRPRLRHAGGLLKARGRLPRAA
ncbi:MAG: hypothetical protein ABFC62_03970 [Clostridiaceae bacterium]|nr:hypothetical protein [Eubacteriales bacterium]